MYILVGLISLYLLFFFLSSEGGAAQWLRGKMAQVAKEEGAGLTEYALLLALIAIVCIAILWQLICYIWYPLCYLYCTFYVQNNGPPCPLDCSVCPYE